MDAVVESISDEDVDGVVETGSEEDVVEDVSRALL